MFDPPEALHAHFEAALASVRAHLGAEHPMRIGGEDVRAVTQFAVHGPIDRRVVLGRFQSGTAAHASAALDAAARAFPAWSATPWQERVAILRRAADLIEARVYEIGAVLALEVGKNRMEALGEAQETADLIRYACDRMEAGDGYVHAMARDPVAGFTSDNTSVMKPWGPWLVIAPFNFPLALAGGPPGAALVAGNPVEETSDFMRPYGVWAVISPFNFPMALAAGPIGAALVAGNTVVLKPASATPWSARLFALALHDAGVPPGVFNLVTGSGAAIGEPRIRDARVAGATFTGSY
ncbi:MAG: aldehyde dehydrogenase family protein, partial [Vicinamibacteria bacterium]